jgi:hypothetical protein
MFSLKHLLGLLFDLDDLNAIVQLVKHVFERQF